MGTVHSSAFDSITTIVLIDFPFQVIGHLVKGSVTQLVLVTRALRQETSRNTWYVHLCMRYFIPDDTRFVVWRGTI